MRIIRTRVRSTIQYLRPRLHSSISCSSSYYPFLLAFIGEYLRYSHLPSSPPPEIARPIPIHIVDYPLISSSFDQSLLIVTMHASYVRVALLVLATSATAPILASPIHVRNATDASPTAHLPTRGIPEVRAETMARDHGVADDFIVILLKSRVSVSEVEMIPEDLVSSASRAYHDL
ncbi:hypothetical protein BGY98DRAFT_982912, partial [Russula aff. rugulosa BPL654]